MRRLLALVVVLASACGAKAPEPPVTTLSPTMQQVYTQTCRTESETIVLAAEVARKQGGSITKWLDYTPRFFEMPADDGTAKRVQVDVVPESECPSIASS